MDYKNFENLETNRKIRLFSFVILQVVTVVLIAYTLFIARKNAYNLVYVFLAVLFLPIVDYLLCLLYFRLFPFDAKVKSCCISSFMKEIVREKGDISWFRDFNQLSKEPFYESLIEDVDLGFFARRSINEILFASLFTGFVNLGFFDRRGYIRMDVNDVFQGSYLGSRFVASDVSIDDITYERRYNYSNRRARFSDFLEETFYGYNRRRRRHSGVQKRNSIFRGVVIEIDAGRNFGSGLLVVPKGESLRQSGFYQLMPPKELTSEFFDIYARNGGARIIPLNELFKFLRYFNREITVGFAGNKIVVMLPSFFDTFKMGSIFKRVDDKNQYQKFKNDFLLMLNIIENLSKIANENNLEQNEIN